MRELIYYNGDRWASQFGSGITPYFELDEVTGLPKVLDERAYWKIKKSILGPDYMEIHYMTRTRWWPFGVSAACGFISGVRDREATPEEILWEALYAINLRAEAIKLAKNPPPPVKKDTNPPVSQSKWYGKYPPKSLKEMN